MPKSTKYIHTLATILLILIVSATAQAQLRRYPHQHGDARQTAKRSPAVGRTKQTPPLKLPFFDDFSKPLNKMYPDTARWADGYTVWVNDGMGIHPPTIFVATFDGLDSAGAAYNPNDILQTGYTDELVSKPIDLSTVPAAERSTVYLSFFYQWAGNVEGPDEQDFLQLDFKTAEEAGWESVMTIYPKENADKTIFYDTIIQVNGDRFFHDRFQFRLRSFGRMSGPFDAWHIDYVYLNKNRNINDLSFPDRALSTQLGPLFGPYRAMPRDHFFSSDQLTPPTFEIQNMKNAEASVNFRTEGFFSHTDEDTDQTTTYSTVISKATPINITSNVLFAKEHREIRMDTLPNTNDPQQFPPDPTIDSTLIRLTIALQTRDDVPLNRLPPVEADSTGDYTRNYSPIRFTTNDTISADYVLSSYYAYDDGVAEYSAGLIQAGNLVAYAFDIDTTYALKQDTLIGFDIYFPPHSVSANQTVDFFIYHDDNGVPGEQWLRIPLRRVLRKGVNQFQRIEFLPALLIDEGRFYIGWSQPGVGKVSVGLDMSNDTGDRIFVNTNGTWYQNEEVRGSLMLRPVFGSGIIDSSVGINDEETVTHVYPNPGKGVFYITGDVSDPVVFSMTGAPVPIVHRQDEGRTEVRLATEVPGIYLLRFRSNGSLKTHKIVMVR